MFRAILFLLLASTSAYAAEGASNLLTGAQHFRAGRFAEALVQFRVAERFDKSGQAQWYAAASLVQLKRSQDAVDTFIEAERNAPHLRDDILDYYFAVACSDARLYLHANRILARIGASAGPRISEEARKLHTKIESLLHAEPSRGSVDWYYRMAADASKGGRNNLAGAYLAEGAALSDKRADHYRPATPPSEKAE